ncbi:MAG TPA: vitamin K epoxide reductase family protein [Candidatus Polarisedimenticolaceae bacterium]|nr:vitamin K epoxide reductase family protein [Candidatus Polarisedimenticolaceae bacterium]
MIPPPLLRAGGPADALAAAARHLGLDPDPTDLRARFERHPAPQSLLALVQVASTLGIEARAFQATSSDLETLRLPAVVHLRGAGAGGDDAFALLVARQDAAVVLEDPEDGRRFELSPAEFAGVWSGVLVQLAHGAAPAEPVRASWIRARFRDLDAASATAEAARLVGLIVLVALGVAAAARLGLERRAVGVGIGAAGGLVLDLLGTIVSAALFYAGRRTRVAGATPRFATVICGSGRLGDCEGVLSSRWARVGGVDLASLGFGFFASCLLVAAAGTLLRGPRLVALFAELGATHLAALPAALFLVGVQLWPLRRICPLCMSAHAVVLAGSALGVAWLAATWDMLRAADLAPIVALHTASFLGVIGLVLPYLELGLETRAHRARLGWIQATPWGALAELAGRPPVIAGRLDAAIRLGRPFAPFRLDALVHPFCSGCPPLLERLSALALRYADALEVGFHLPPRDSRNPADRELCAALSTLGLLAGGEQTLHVYGAVKDRPWHHLELARTGGAARVLHDYLAPDVDVAAALERGRAAVDAADRLATRLRRGTPALLLNGRPWEGTLDDLERLLADHAALLGSVLRVELAP